MAGGLVGAGLLAHDSHLTVVVGQRYRLASVGNAAVWRSFCIVYSSQNKATALHYRHDDATRNPIYMSKKDNMRGKKVAANKAVRKSTDLKSAEPEVPERAKGKR